MTMSDKCAICGEKIQPLALGWVHERIGVYQHAASLLPTMESKPSEDIAAGRQEGEEWEAFRDLAYFDMWCVRKVGDRMFGQGFHVPSEEEAEGLRAELSKSAALREEITKLSHLTDNANAIATKAVEELARLREKVREMAELLREYEADCPYCFTITCPQECGLCFRTRALLETKLLAPAPADTPEKEK